MFWRKKKVFRKCRFGYHIIDNVKLEEIFNFFNPKVHFFDIFIDDLGTQFWPSEKN